MSTGTVSIGTEKVDRLSLFFFFKPAKARLEAAPGNNWPNQDPIIRTIIADPV
jgi:hypothetical protein